MSALLARIGEFLSMFGRQAVPIGGLFGRDWQPVTALVVYWLESVLLALVVLALCVLVQRRSSPAAAVAARRAGDMDAARAIDAESLEARKAGINPSDFAVVYIGSMAIFGGFFGGILFIMISNGHIEQGFVWSEIRDGALAMLAVIGFGFLLDLWRFPSMSVADVQSRVDGCMGRWALFWILGFFGVLVLMFTGKAALFFGLFAGLKTTWEVWGWLARTFGWRSLKEREMESRASA